MGLLNRVFGGPSRMNTAAGPFSSEFFKAFKQAVCMQCGREINARSLFGNSLVVEPRRVVIKCLLCREDRTPEKDDGIPPLHKRVDLDWVIYCIHEHTDEHTGELMSWFYVLNGLRFGGDSAFSKVGIRCGIPYGPMKASLAYGNLASAETCGECGVPWNRDWYTDSNYDRVWIDRDSDKCPGCGLPHKRQFHMRIGRDEEEFCLTKGVKQN
jgi:hypothetical protein